MASRLLLCFLGWLLWLVCGLYLGCGLVSLVPLVTCSRGYDFLSFARGVGLFLFDGMFADLYVGSGIDLSFLSPGCGLIGLPVDICCFCIGLMPPSLCL